MHVKNLDTHTTSSKNIKLVLKHLNNIGGSGFDIFMKVIESGDYYIAVGSSTSNLSGLTGGSAGIGLSDFIIAKFNKSDLSLVQINNLGGTSNDRFESVIESGSYYIVAGYSSSDLSGLTGGSTNSGDNDFVIAKLNISNLSLVNINNFGVADPQKFNELIESNNYYIAAGEAEGDLSSFTGGAASQGNSDFVIAKFNASDLSLVNVNNLGGTLDDTLNSIIESNGYYIAVGESGSNLSALNGGTTIQGGTDFVIARFNTSDLTLDRINNPGGTVGETLLEVIGDSTCYIAVGYSYSDLSGLPGGNNTQGLSDFTIAKFNASDLSLLAIKNIGGSSVDSFYGITASGNYYTAVGCSSSDLSALAPGNNTAGGIDTVIAKFNASDLSFVDLKMLGESNGEVLYSVLESGNYYIAVGYSQSDLSSFTGGSGNEGLQDFVITKFGE